jgi:hypothetical protein
VSIVSTTIDALVARGGAVSRPHDAMQAAAAQAAAVRRIFSVLRRSA